MSLTAEIQRRILAACGRAIKKHTGALEVRVRALEGMQQKTLADAFQGAWLAGREYRRGCLVQHADALWLCLDTTDQRPGQSPAWRALAPTR